MDAGAILPRRRLIGATWREALARKQSRLLAEFLWRNSAPMKPAEETASQDSEAELHIQTTLSPDLLNQIFMLLPAESLFRLQFVCKQWFGLINTPTFVTSHARKSETVLLSQHLAFWPNEGKPKAYFHFLSLDCLSSSFVESSVPDLASVRASYNGLVLASNGRRKRLVLMNPITGKHVELPLGVSSHHLCESFGIAFCSEAKTYKVVHLFREVLGGVGCEILSVDTRKWMRIKGPHESIRVRQMPVSVGGSLHWLASKRERDCFVSMDVRGERFVAKKLPAKREWGDRLVEIGGSLGFVSHAEVNTFQVWIMNGLGECWMKRCSINLSGCVPVCSRRDGEEMVLESAGGRLCVYNFGRDETRVVNGGGEPWFGKKINRLYIPHRNTLNCIM
ncbi:F-box/LRR-repeat/kelch-repeat protein At2g27520-like isoform X2 [Salvia miltiorrhiza]|nr:F-box/LRR-repeat/kelch-repeat protein At2g27520-like isoform X2 [Salvia miltiorrhiza]